MTFSGLSLVLAAAVCHAVWNFFIKKINSGPELIWLFSALSFLLYLPLVLYVVTNQHVDIDAIDFSFILGSSLLHLGYFLLLQRGYRYGDLSLVYPTARATGPVLSTLFAVVFLGETPTLQSAFGTVIIILGVLRLTGGLRQKARHVLNSLLFGLGAGLLIGSYTAWDAYTVSVLTVSPLLLDYATSTGRAFLLAPIAFKRRDNVVELWKNYRKEVLIVAILAPLSYIFVLYAMTFTPVIFVAPLREISVLLSVLAGSLLLGEGQLKGRLIWGIVILAGISLLATA